MSRRETSSPRPVFEKLEPRWLMADGVLIVTNSTLSAAFQDVADWYTRKGYAATIVDVADIYTSYSGADNQQKIRNCISDYHNNQGVDWVVLGGDNTIVPDRDTYVTCAGETASNMPTDFYYGSLSGTWNSDGDGTYGEAGQDTDVTFLYDVIVARYPVRTAQQVTDLFAKVQSYETSPPSSNWATRMLSAGDLLWSSYSSGTYNGIYFDHTASDAEIKAATAIDEYIDPYWSGYTVDEFFDTNTSWDSSSSGDYQLNSSNLNNKMDRGYQFMHMSTHGSQNSWGLESGSYSVYSMPPSSNPANVSILTTMACLTGAYDDNTYDPSLSEAFLRSSDTGTIAYMGCSRYGWGYDSTTLGCSIRYSFQFYKEFFGNGNRVLGKAFAESKEYFDQNSPYSSVTDDNGAYRWVMFGLNLQGDPLVSMYDQDPVAISPTHDSSIVAGSQTYSVTGLSNGDRVCLWQGNDVYQVGTANSSGEFSASIDAVVGTVKLTIVSPNAPVYTADIEVVADEGTVAAFDFGSSSSPLRGGYTLITPDSTYTSGNGYGWTYGTIDSRDRSGGTTLSRDFNFTQHGIFEVDVTNGTYEVTVTLGDASNARSAMRVYFEDTYIETASTSAGQWYTHTYTVEVSDGKLTFSVYTPLADEDVPVCGLSIVDVDGPRVSDVSPGPFSTGNLSSLNVTFNESVEDGTFTVDDIVSLTGPDGAITPTGVSKVDSSNYTVSFAEQTGRGTYTLTLGPDIADASGNSMNQDDDATNGEATEDRYSGSVELMSGYLYDMGTGASPVRNGYTRVAGDTDYSSVAGYGWLSGTLADRDRAIGADHVRDLCFTADGTFAVDVANGTYDVTVTVGDALFEHQQQRVYMEGVLIDTVTTSAGTFTDVSSEVTVSDGQLTLTFDSAAGGGQSAAIAAIAVADINPPVVVEVGPDTIATGSVDRITLEFSKAIDASTFTTGDIVALTGPGGAITSTGVTQLSGTRFEVNFATQSTVGDYTLTIGPDITDLAGNQMDQDGDGTAGEATEDRYSTTFTLGGGSLFDFGPGSQTVKEGYTGISRATIYSADAGYGWLSGSVSDRDRQTGTDLTRDFCFTTNATFAVDVDPGVYDVTVTLGDPFYDHSDQRVTLEGALQETVSTTAGTPYTQTYQVTVTDGQLTLLLDYQAGGSSDVAINALVVKEASVADTLGPRVVEVSPLGSVTSSLDSITLTFDQDIQDGTFTTDDVASLSGPGGSITPTGVSKVNARQYTVEFAEQTSPGDYTLTIGPDILDDAGNGMNQDADATSGEAGEDQYSTTISLLNGWLFDFGSSSSPLAPGYTRISERSLYGSAVGYGWTGGTVASRDRRLGTDLTRDLCFTESATFVVDADPGVYDVTVTLGDPFYDHSDQRISLEGSLQETVSTTAGTPYTQTYQVTVTDGQLTLLLDYQAGGSSDVAINALVVEEASVADTFGPKVTTALPGEMTTSSFDRVTLTFNEALNAAEFTSADVVSLTGPGGAIAVDSVTNTGGNTWEIAFASQSTAGDYSLTLGVNVPDSAGNLLNQDGDGTNGEDPDDRYTMSWTLVDGYVFDMGTSSSPVATGYTKVSNSTTIYQGLGYGWFDGAVHSRDRGLSDSLNRDLCFTTGAQFLVNVDNGTYDVSVTLGDDLFAHNDQRISLEGSLKGTVSTSAGQHTTVTYQTTVSDGWLNILLDYQGSEGHDVAVNRIVVSSAGGTWLPPESTSVFVEQPLTADATLDGKVSEGDLAILASHWGNSSGELTWKEGDFNGDGRVSAADLGILAANWGKSVSSDDNTGPLTPSENGAHPSQEAGAPEVSASPSPAFGRQVAAEAFSLPQPIDRARSDRARGPALRTAPVRANVLPDPAGDPGRHSSSTGCPVLTGAQSDAVHPARHASVSEILNEAEEIDVLRLLEVKLAA